ncbi:hypothetical protein B296_00006347 [Ensete ventricosum]|uniref:Uncharacterized protein n=1 Tax=Ensete ventricosum TaxID=4639 RepID=A0A426ZC40_ENSVE|nr:hypothetical protein B296_00006347 [Ensete ventricosum]
MKVREIDFRSGIDGSKGRCIDKESWLKRGRQQIDGSVTWWVTVDGGNVKSNCGNCLEDGGAEMAIGQQERGSDTK